MKLSPRPSTLQQQGFAALITAALSLTTAAAVSAATPEPAQQAKPVKAAVATVPATKPATQCMKDMSAFQSQMQKDGYWRGTSGYGYGYPMLGYDYDGGVMAPTTPNAKEPGDGAYWRARPGFEVRTLLAATQVLAQNGKQAPCEALLAETRQIYTRYAAEMRDNKIPRYDIANYRQTQLKAAQPVTDQNTSYHSDQLIGTEVLNAKGEELGSVDDLVLNAQTGKIAYLLIARGGLFGFDQKYVPVPWAIFKATPGAKTLVLDTTKDDMKAAPHIKEDRFTTAGDFAKQNSQVDAYWSGHLKK